MSQYVLCFCLSLNAKKRELLWELMGEEINKCAPKYKRVWGRGFVKSKELELLEQMLILV